MVLESNTLDVLFVKDGQQGEDGKILYTWIKYAKDASGTGITDDPNGAIYIGISYNNESSIESNDPTQYAWTKIQGADGKKGEDAYTIFLENENISFATDENRNPLSEQAYTSGITIMKGAKPVTDFTIGDIAKTQGIAVAKTDTAIAISVVNGNPLPNDSGEIEIPITVGGTVFKKIITWTCAKKGDQGQDGISPKVSLSKSGDTTTISIVDATGTHTQTVKDGTNGTPGAAGKDGKTSYFHVKYSNDGGKTFTSNSGEDTGIYMGSYTDYTEADSTDVNKYNWVKVKGDKGDTGQKGQDGTSIKITSKSVTYQTSTSGTTAPTGTWSTTVPTVNNGQYLWTKTTVQYSDGNKTEAYSVSYKGTNGTNGTSVTVSKTEVTYQVTTSGTTAPTGTWSTTMPSCDQGQYLWTKTYVKYSDGKDTTSYSVSYKGVDGEKFAFNMLRETNQGSKHWVNMGASGKYSVESITTEDSINAVKLICTEPIASNEWQFCDFSDYEMLKSLKASTTYTLSYDIKTNRSGKILHNIKTGGGQKVFFANDIACKVLGNETWEHVSLKMTSGTTLPNLDGQVIYMFGDALSKVGYSIIKNLKLTEGIVDTPWAPHPEDLEGRGVSETVQYYLATSQASGVTSSTSGWSTDITTQKLTADKKYLWNCYQTKYSDDTSEPISTPKVIGVYGDKGQKGDNAKNLSITPSSQYFKSTDGGKTFAPDTITIKPTIQGEINFGKWQYSIDGGVSFADAVSGQKGLTISNNVLTVSKDSSLYSDAVTMVTFRAVASDSSFYDTCSIAKIYDVSDVGDGRNLLTGVSSYTKDTPFEKTDSRADGWIVYQNIITSIELEAGKKYVLQAKTDGNWAADHNTNGQDPSKKLVTLWLVSNTTNDFFDMRQGYVVFTPTVTAKYKLRVNQYSNGTDAYTIHLWDIKLEKGSSPTGWTPAPEDVQTAILSTKSEISDVSLKVDKNKQAIEQRVEKTTYQQDLNLVKGDISKANEGLNKWRYEIYPKSLFASEYQGKSTMDVFVKNTNLTPSQSMLINDTDLSIAWNYDNNYIGYALTFAKFSTAKSVAITFAHDDGAHIYLNGKLIGGRDAYNRNGESLTLGFVKGWNCIEVVVNEGGSTEGFTLGTTISALSECQLMNCYYGTPVARQSHITNQLVENTTNIKGISTKVSKVTSVIGDNGENFTSFKNDYSDFKQTMNGFKTTVGQTYVTKDDFNGLEIGGRNLLLYSQTIRAHNNYYGVSYLIDEVETFNGCPVWSVKNQWGRLVWSFKSHVIDRGLVKVGDTLTYSLYAKTNNASGKSISCSYRFKGNAQAYWFKGSAFNIGTSWARYSATFTVTKDMLATDTYMNEIGFEETASMSGDDKVYYTCPKLERGTKATDYTPAPEDVNGKIVNVETIANQTANKFEWIVKGGDSSSNFTLTDRVADLVAERINFNGLVTFSGLSTDAKNEIGKVAQSKVDGLEVGGRNLLKRSSMIGEKLVCDNYFGCNNCDTKEYTNEGFHIITTTEGNANNGIAFSFDNFTILGINGGDTITFSCDIKGTSDSHAPFVSIHISDNNWYGSDVIQQNTGVSITKDWQRVSVTITTPTGLTKNHMWLAIHGNYQSDLYVRNFKLEKGNKATDWTPAPEDVSQDATNKASQALTDAKNYSSNAVNWVTSNGSSTTSLNSMVKKWTDGAVSDTAQINGGWIKANTITASKIAIGDFTNYCQLDKDTASSYGFTATDDTKGVWYTASPIDRDKHISQWFTCEGGQKLYVEYDLSTTVKGKVEASDTDISYLTSGIMIYAANGAKQIVSYTRSKGVTATSDGAITHVSLVETLPADTRFFKVVLQTNGQGNTFSGTLKIRNPQVRKATTGKLIVDGSITADKIAANAITADKIATDAIKSHNYISSGGTQGSFLNLKDGSFTAPNLSWDLNGNLIAKNANLSGEITATKGTIGKYEITDQWLTTGSGSTCTGIGGNQAFWAGAEDSNSAPFRVGYDGVLWAENAAIRGSIETGNLGDEGDTVSIINGHIGIRGTSNNVEIYSTGFKFGIDGDYYLESVSEGVKCYRNLYATDFIADGWIYNASGGHYTWKDRDDAYISCGDYNGHNVYYYANYHAFYVNKDSGQGMMYINTNGVTSRVGFTKTSDERIKKNFESFDDNIIDAYMNIEPVKYQLKQSSNDKYHFGFKAQHVDKVFSDYGDTYNESFDICTSRPIDPDKAKELYGVDDMTEEYGLRYDELIAPTTYMVQHIYKELESTKGELAKVKQEKTDLETRLQAIEAKLGL